MRIRSASPIYVLTNHNKRIILTIIDISNIDINDAILYFFKWQDDRISSYMTEVNEMAREQLKNLTEPMYYILLALTSKQHGYGIMQTIDTLTSGRVKVGAGTLYALLARFEKEKIIFQVSEDGRKKIYQITDKGYRLLNEEFERLNQLVLDGKKYLDKRSCHDE